MRWTGKLVVVAVATWPLLAGAPARAEGPLALEGVKLSGGVFEVLGAGHVAEGGVELRARAYELPGLPRFVPDPAPLAGVMATGDGSVYAYAGFRLDFRVTPRFTVTPNWAVGAYEQGDGRDLGGVVEFRSALDLSYRVSRRATVGLSFYHLSNAGLYDRNPGSESLVLTYAFGAPWREAPAAP